MVGKRPYFISLEVVHQSDFNPGIQQQPSKATLVTLDMRGQCKSKQSTPKPLHPCNQRQPHFHGNPNNAVHPKYSCFACILVHFWIDFGHWIVTFFPGNGYSLQSNKDHTILQYLVNIVVSKLWQYIANKQKLVMVAPHCTKWISINM